MGNGRTLTGDDLEIAENPQGTVETDDLTTWNGESGDAHTIEPNPTPSAPAPDDDDIEREAIQNESEFDADQSAPKTAWDI